MATLFSSTTFLSHPNQHPQRRTHQQQHHFSSSSQPPTPPPSQPPSSSSSSSSSAEQQLTPVTVNNNKSSQQQQQQQKQKPNSSRNVESTDWIASSLTRRFGLGAGLAWAGFLAFGVVSEQIKTRLEVSQEQANTRNVENEEEVVLPNGIRYYELRVGGGAMPRTGDLVVIDLKGKVEGSEETFVDTFKKQKPLALVMGSRPYSKGMCEGIEEVLRSMKAGGKRRVIIPPSLGFGEQGADLGNGVQVPPSATLEYIVQVDRVSIAPA